MECGNASLGAGSVVCAPLRAARLDACVQRCTARLPCACSRQQGCWRMEWARAWTRTKNTRPSSALPIDTIIERSWHSRGGPGNTVGGEIRNVQNSEWRNLVKRKFHQFLNATATFGANSRIVAQEQESTLNGGCYWWVTVISNSLHLLNGCSYCLEAVGHNGNAHAKRAKSPTQKDGFLPSNTAA